MAEEEFVRLGIDLEAIWATRISPEQVRVYLNERYSLTMSVAAAAALERALGWALERTEQEAERV